MKQRHLGRTSSLEACMDMLQSGYWLYVGFSAADLEGTPDYLGLAAGAAGSPGAVYVAWPGNPALGTGAKLLMRAYGERGGVVVANVEHVSNHVCQALGSPGPEPVLEDGPSGREQFLRKLEAWSRDLSPVAAGVCLAAIFEASGDAEVAARILDRMVRKEFLDEHGTADFRAAQLHYGRLGAAWGRFVAVPDLNGQASNASVEALQSLLRLRGSDRAFAAEGWLCCSLLWQNQGQQAMKASVYILEGFIRGSWEHARPRNEEELVDAWLSAAQVFVLNTHADLVKHIIASAHAALDRARATGDIVRMARVAALQLLAMAESTEDLPGRADAHTGTFAEATRVGDGFALGMRSLALGRWHVGESGLALGREIGREAVASRAAGFLGEAVDWFTRQGLDPWAIFATLQRVKALADLHLFDDSQVDVQRALAGLRRFPVFASHLHEAVAQVQTMIGDVDAASNFKSAMEAAQASGLHARRDTLARYLS